MNCREFERGLEALSDGAAPAALRAYEEHAATCGACSELLALARLPASEPGDLVAGVLSRTSGSACRQAEARLPEFVDGLLSSADGRELVAAHLEHCSSCSGLIVELERLAADLPRLAIVEPDVGLVDAVLRRTLPLPVQLRRWWAAAWPRWVRRPRFATELAYALTLVLVVAFGTPVSPLQAMPERALDFARTDPGEQIEQLQAVTREEISERLQAAAESGSRQAWSWVEATRETAGTILEEVASWFVTAADDTPAESNETTEETS
ncbi:MAG: anti-sigma factor family protein [Thermoanaerobaculia bacterium]